MNKFDEHIKAAEDVYVPDPHFVDETMKRIVTEKPRRRFAFKNWGMALAGVATLLAIAVIALPKPNQNVAETLPKQSTNQKLAQAQTAESAAPISDGTNDTYIARDLADVQGSLAQAGSDQSNADSSLSDQQIQIPTD